MDPTPINSQAPSPTHPGPDPAGMAATESEHPPRREELGQATAEYALVMLAAAALAGLLLAWASSSGGIDRLLNAVMDSLIDQVG